MANTPYSRQNAQDSERAHIVAQTEVYPILLGVDRERLEFVDCTGDGARERILDGEMAIDRMVKITVSGLRMPITLTVQERFRKIEYSRWRDLTITEWNPMSNLPSELYKLTAGLFVYGYFDYAKGKFGEVVMIETAALLRSIANRSIRYTTNENPRSKQPFLCIKFDDMAAANVILETYMSNEKQVAMPDFLKTPYRQDLFQWATP